MCDCDSRHDHSEHYCSCPDGKMERFIQPCILLLLYEKPGHGYELMEKLSEFGFDMPDPGAVYRNLRRMEDEGWVTSKWETEGAGPARRLYTITPSGIDAVHAWASAVQRNIRRLSYFLQRYNKDFGGQGEV